MAQKFHINSKGVASACKALKGKCPFGGDENHYNSIEEAQEMANKKNEEEFGLIPKVLNMFSKVKVIQNSLKYKLDNNSLNTNVNEHLIEKGLLIKDPDVLDTLESYSKQLEEVNSQAIRGDISKREFEEKVEDINEEVLLVVAKVKTKKKGYTKLNHPEAIKNEKMKLFAKENSIDFDSLIDGSAKKRLKENGIDATKDPRLHSLFLNAKKRLESLPEKYGEGPGGDFYDEERRQIVQEITESIYKYEESKKKENTLDVKRVGIKISTIRGNISSKMDIHPAFKKTVTDYTLKLRGKLKGGDAEYGKNYAQQIESLRDEKNFPHFSDFDDESKMYLGHLHDCHIEAARMKYKGEISERDYNGILNNLEESSAMVMAKNKLFWGRF